MTTRMKGHPGDWLVVHSRDEHHHEQSGVIVECHGPDDSAPFLVRWDEDGRETLVFPGPDSAVYSAEDYAARNAASTARALKLQKEIQHLS